MFALIITNNLLNMDRKNIKIGLGKFSRISGKAASPPPPPPPLLISSFTRDFAPHCLPPPMKTYFQVSVCLHGRSSPAFSEEINI